MPTAAVVTIACDAFLGLHRCPVTAWGRHGEDLGETLDRAFEAGWMLQPTPGTVGGRYRCPWHASGRFGGSGPL